MEIEYRKLVHTDLDTFISMRIAQLREEGAKEDIDLAPALRDYYTRHMADGTFISWLAVSEGKIVGTSGMSIVEKPPYFGCPSGRIGLLSSMFTDSGFRRRGIARELLTRVVDEAKKAGCGTVQITASDMGVLLYTDFGFVKNKILCSINWKDDILWENYTELSLPTVRHLHRYWMPRISFQRSSAYTRPLL